MMIANKQSISLDQLVSISGPDEFLAIAYGSLENIQLPIDVEDIARRIDAVQLTNELDFSNFSRFSQSGEIRVVRDTANPYVEIWTNPTHHENRRRFTIAHELGHLIYDVLPHINDLNYNESFKDNDEIMFKRAGEQKVEEYRANAFAADLLMPKILIANNINHMIRAAESHSQPFLDVRDVVNHLAIIFGVSTQAMEIRLKNIGYINN